MQLGGGEHPGRVLVLPVCVFPDADETIAYVPRVKLGQAGEDVSLADGEESLMCDREVDGCLESSGDTLTRGRIVEYRVEEHVDEFSRKVAHGSRLNRKISL